MEPLLLRCSTHDAMVPRPPRQPSHTRPRQELQGHQPRMDPQRITENQGPTNPRPQQATPGPEIIAPEITDKTEMTEYFPVISVLSVLSVLSVSSMEGLQYLTTPQSHKKLNNWPHFYVSHCTTRHVQRHYNPTGRRMLLSEGLQTF